MKDYIVFIQDLLTGRNEEFDNADKKRIRLIRHKDNRKYTMKVYFYKENTA